MLNRVWRHKTFESLKTKWFHTQFGDATGVGGRGQDILPLMSADGKMLSVEQGMADFSSMIASVALPPAPPPETPTKNVRFEDEMVRGRVDFDRLDKSLDRITKLLESSNAKPEPEVAKGHVDFDRLDKSLNRVTKLLESSAKKKPDPEPVQSPVDFDRLDKSLDRITKLVESSAKKKPDPEPAQGRVDFDRLDKSLDRITKLFESSAKKKPDPTIDFDRLDKSLDRITKLVESSTKKKSDHDQQGRVDFDRLDKNLDRITRLVESSANKKSDLEQRARQQEDTIKSLTAVLQQSADQIKKLSGGQQKLTAACEELRKTIKEREDRWEKMSVMSAADSSCNHEVVRPPRKVGRRIVGYVYDRNDGIGG